jgi:hypothetical protein
MRPDIGRVRPILAIFALAAVCEWTACNAAAAQSVPLPRERPAEAGPRATDAPAEPAAPKPEEPSACRLRLTPAIAIAPSVPSIEGPGECGGTDLVRLEAVVLADKTRVPLNPPATLRCTMAEALALWVREEAVPITRDLGSPLRAIQNYDSYECRGRNRIAGARISEHGKANALDIRGLRLASGRLVDLTDAHVARDYRERMRRSVCGRFTTVLGPGSDGYHENHIHLDLAQRRGGHRMCQWEIREPAPIAAAVPAEPEVASTVPLPPPRPKIEAKSAPRKKL